MNEQLFMHNGRWYNISQFRKIKGIRQEVDNVDNVDTEDVVVEKSKEENNEPKEENKDKGIYAIG
ncbi:MAG: hypothetical protein PHS34_07645 [Candidatus Omnitrophica bacterium]|nr:hypothetical protein [Candidatus Omnitrophota bacterium]